jgi:hypothetical protein
MIGLYFNIHLASLRKANLKKRNLVMHYLGKGCCSAYFKMIRRKIASPPSANAFAAKGPK